MKKIEVFILGFAMLLILCSCESQERLYSTYNPEIYYGMPQNEVDKILSEKYTTINFGDEINYWISEDQDFMKIDPEFAVPPSVTYKFVDGKLDEINHKYEFPNGVPGSLVELYNTYLAVALDFEEVEIQQWSKEIADGVVWNYFNTAGYEKGDESIILISSNSIDGYIEDLRITFSKSGYNK